MAGLPACNSMHMDPASSHMRRYLGPLPPSRGVQRGPSTSVALQSTQLGALTLNLPFTCSYTPAGQT